MEILRCDVIGCGHSASWVRIKDAKDNETDFLCHACWAKRRIMKPQEALRYVSCDTGASPFPAASYSVLREIENEDVIYIGA